MTVQFIKTPNGDELAVLPRDDYEDLVDSKAARRASEAFSTGAEETLSAGEVQALLAATSPLAFWRSRRGISLRDLAGRLGVDERELTEIEAARHLAPLSFYRRAAQTLAVSMDDLTAD